MKTHYEVLNINNNADRQEIDQAYFSLARLYHPDINKQANPTFFRDITLAYNILKNPVQRKKYDESLKNSGYKDLKQKEQEAEAEFLQGKDLLFNGDFKNAILHFKNATKINSNLSEYYYYLAQAYQKHKILKEAATAIKIAISLDDKNPNYYHTEGYIYKEMGMVKSAQSSFQKILQLEPGNLTAQRELETPLPTKKKLWGLLSK